MNKQQQNKNKNQKKEEKKEKSTKTPPRNDQAPRKMGFGAILARHERQAPLRSAANLKPKPVLPSASAASPPKVLLTMFLSHPDMLRCKSTEKTESEHTSEPHAAQKRKKTKEKKKKAKKEKKKKSSWSSSIPWCGNSYLCISHTAFPGPCCGWEIFIFFLVNSSKVLYVRGVLVQDGEERDGPEVRQ
jgi:hypothetical protein